MLEFQFREAQRELQRILRSLSLNIPGFSPEEISIIYNNPPPIKDPLLLRLESYLTKDIENSTDEDVSETLETVLFYVQKMLILNKSIRALPSAEVRPAPSAPPQTVVYPSLPPFQLPPPPSVLPTPTAFVPPVERTRSRYFFALSVPANASQEQKAAAQQFVDELERLAVLVETHGERFPGLAQVLEPILDKVKPPVKYYGAGFMAIRNFLNGRISEVFTTPASEVQEERLGTLNALIGQVHTIMLCYYRIRRLFNISTVEEDEAKAKAQGQTPSKGWSLFGDEISDDNQ